MTVIRSRPNRTGMRLRCRLRRHRATSMVEYIGAEGDPERRVRFFNWRCSCGRAIGPQEEGAP